MPIRLLGECPECETLDEIVQVPYVKGRSNFNEVKCDKCGTNWKGFFSLVSEEEKKGNRLIPVEIERYRVGVNLESPPKREIPYSDLIVTTLNSALMSKFGLGACFATEGGVEGGGYEFLNCLDNIGLFADDSGTFVQEVLTFYEMMLQQLFQKPINFGGVTLRRGGFLWSDENKGDSDALLYSFATLAVTENKEFAKRVFKNVRNLNPFLASYVRGLSDEEIVQHFVPPPLD